MVSTFLSQSLINLIDALFYDSICDQFDETFLEIVMIVIDL